MKKLLQVSMYFVLASAVTFTAMYLYLQLTLTMIY